jgi:hypothetical protein
MRKSKDRKEKKKDVQHFVLSEKRKEKRRKESMSLMWISLFSFFLFVH